VRRPLLGIALALTSLVLGAACELLRPGRSAEARPCPPGTERAAGETPSGREQWCRRDGTSSRHGPYVAWHANDRVQAEGAFADGRPDGRWRLFYASGQPLLDGEYRDGVKQGLWTFWYANGVKKEAGVFRDGREQGRWIRWFESGQLQSEGEYRDGVPDRRWTFWHDRGPVRATGDYRNGERALPWRRASVTGQICD
jgi:antitoxin component YwqK of YwqJK toxin-antitoxin module